MIIPEKFNINRIASLLLVISSLAITTFIFGQVNPKDSAKTSEVLYIGLDNPIKIVVPGVKKDLMEVSIDQGTIIGESGNYIIRPVKSGNTTILSLTPKNPFSSESPWN
jgi:hypothetical protein